MEVARKQMGFGISWGAFQLIFGEFSCIIRLLQQQRIHMGVLNPKSPTADARGLNFELTSSLSVKVFH